MNDALFATIADEQADPAIRYDLPHIFAQVTRAKRCLLMGTVPLLLPLWFFLSSLGVVQAVYGVLGFTAYVLPFFIAVAHL